jgi:hypothetical protein
MSSIPVKQPCQFHLLGKCMKGSDLCTFSHDPKFCRPGGSGRLCRNFATNGVCKYGDLCVHLHKSNTGQALESAYYYGDQSSQRGGEEIVGFYGEPPLSSLNINDNSTTSSPQTSWANVARLPNQNQVTFHNRELETVSSSKTLEATEKNWANVAKRISSSETSGKINLNTDTKVATNKVDVERPSTNIQPLPKIPAPCKFFFSSTGCRAGEQCRFSHESQTGLKASGSNDLTCGICFESLKFKRVGILTHCNHVFCLSCIRGWRSSEMSEVEKTKEIVQTCPVCRVRSFFVVPSDVIPTSPEEKQKLIEEFREKCQKIPCKYTDDDCPFGTSCMYYHKIVDPAKLGLRFAKTAEGGDRALAATVATLGEFILK